MKEGETFSSANTQCFLEVASYVMQRPWTLWSLGSGLGFFMSYSRYTEKGVADFTIGQIEAHELRQRKVTSPDR